LEIWFLPFSVHAQTNVIYLTLAALQSLYDNKDMNRVWENIKENIKSSAIKSLGVYEWKQHKPWCDEECSQFLNHREQTKM